MGCYLERLCAISEDARLSFTELARLIGTSPAVVKYRVEKLEELGVIAGYRVDVDRRSLGMTQFKVQVQPRQLDATQELEFHAYCRMHPLISVYVLQLGDCKVEFDIEAKDYAQFSAVMDEIRERFSGFIRGIDYMMVREDYYHRAPCNVFAREARLAAVGA